MKMAISGERMDVDRDEAIFANLKLSAIKQIRTPRRMWHQRRSNHVV